MDSRDPYSIVINEIMKLEPENASNIIAYLLSMEQSDVIHIASGPISRIHDFIRKAESSFRRPSNGFSSNPSSGPINVRGQPLFQSSPRNEFLDFSRYPNPLPPSLPSSIPRYNPNANSSPVHGGSSQQQQQSSNHFPFFNNENPANRHGRSFSANDASLGSQRPGSWNLPGGLVGYSGPPGGFGSPSERLMLAQQQRMVAAQAMAARGSPIQGSGQFGVEGGYCDSPGRRVSEDGVSRRIHLNFSSQRSFTKDDVSNYFSNFGPVKTVIFPGEVYGFVTFFNAETVATVLAQRNPHFIGVPPTRVTVKSYIKKENQKSQQSQQQQQSQLMMGTGNYFPSSSPSPLDSRNLSSSRFGTSIFSNDTPEMLRRRQAVSQQAIEVENQRRRLVNLQLPDMENKSIPHHQRTPSIGTPAYFPPQGNHSLLFPPETIRGYSDGGEKHVQQVTISNEERGHSNHFYRRQETSVEDTLPDRLFDSPKRSGETGQTESDSEQNRKRQ